MVCRITANDEVNHTHKHALRVLYKDYESPLEMLFSRSGTHSINVKTVIIPEDTDAMVINVKQ